MPIPRPDAHHEHLIQLYRELAAFAAGFIPAKLATSPEPDDILAHIDDLGLLCRHFDRVVRGHGEYVNAHTGRRVDLSLFTDQGAGALEGNAYFEISEAAQDIRDQMEAA